VFKSVDYQDKDADSGTVSLSGTGEPGARIFLFFDEDPLGQVVIGDDGTWKFEAEKKVAVGEHNFRADHLDEKTGTVLGRASIGIVRMEPPKEEAKAPEPETQAAAEAPASESAKAAPQVAATEEAKPAPSADKQVQRKRHLPRTYTVRRGDTLWEIAEAYYGGGWHYRAIVKDNRKKIRNPWLIYPKQKFHIPPR
jgi:nucleoid-associated protein YgaU